MLLVQQGITVLQWSFVAIIIYILNFQGPPSIFFWGGLRFYKLKLQKLVKRTSNIENRDNIIGMELGEGGTACSALRSLITSENYFFCEFFQLWPKSLLLCVFYTQAVTKICLRVRISFIWVTLRQSAKTLDI